MNRWMWIGLVAVFLIGMYYTALPGSLPAGIDHETGIAGTYTVNGVSASGIEYSGTVIIRRASVDEVGGFEGFSFGAHDDLYSLQWTVTGSIDTGVGAVSGNEMRLVWQTVSTAGPPSGGTGQYTIQTDGQITGTRTVEGLEGESTEELFFEQ